MNKSTWFSHNDHLSTPLLDNNQFIVICNMVATFTHYQKHDRIGSLKILIRLFILLDINDLYFYGNWVSVQTSPINHYLSQKFNFLKLKTAYFPLFKGIAKNNQPTNPPTYCPNIPSKGLTLIGELLYHICGYLEDLACTFTKHWVIRRINRCLPSKLAVKLTDILITTLTDNHNDKSLHIAFKTTLNSLSLFSLVVSIQFILKITINT